jgi:hypothetical protein
MRKNIHTCWSTACPLVAPHATHSQWREKKPDLCDVMGEKKVENPVQLWPV